MALRKEVFQSKVLQKLYPASSKSDKKPCASPNVDTLTKKTIVKSNIQGNSHIGKTSIAAQRMYTVLPPPADYKADSEKPVTHSEPENLLSTEDPDVNSSPGSNNELAKEPEEKKKRRRTKKRKDPVLSLNQTAVNEGEEHLSKNKKRKLKKKRHKEKLLSMGLVPRAVAVEFTYQRDEMAKDEGEEGSSQSNDPAQDEGENP